MPAVEVVRNGECIVIRRRQRISTWFPASPYILYECFVVAVPLAAFYKLSLDFSEHHAINFLALLGFILFGLQGWFIGRALYRMLFARSVFTVRGDTLEIEVGTLFSLKSIGTYGAAGLSGLDLNPGSSLVLPAGKVTVKVANVSVTLADYINTSDGSQVISELCEAYPFNTTAPTPSPYVSRW